MPRYWAQCRHKKKMYEKSYTLIPREQTWHIYTKMVIIAICSGNATTAWNRNHKFRGNRYSVGCFWHRLWEGKIGLSKVQNIHLQYFSQRLFSSAIATDSVTLAVPDGHINILHIHLEQILALTKGASICLAASTLPGDSLGAEDKHICTANTPNEPSWLNWKKCLFLYYSATVSLAISQVSTNSSVFDSI